MNRLISRRLARAALAGSVAIALSGCFLPDNYKSTLHLKKDMTYSLSYTGEVVHIMAMERGYGYADYRKGSPADKERIDAAEKEFGPGVMKEDNSVKSFEYVGGMRHRVVIEADAPMPKEGTKKEIFFFTQMEVDKDSVIVSTSG